jgi:hypothetical protein
MGIREVEDLQAPRAEAVRVAIGVGRPLDDVGAASEDPHAASELLPGGIAVVGAEVDKVFRRIQADQLQAGAALRYVAHVAVGGHARPVRHEPVGAEAVELLRLREIGDVV